MVLDAPRLDRLRTSADPVAAVQAMADADPAGFAREALGALGAASRDAPGIRLQILSADADGPALRVRALAFFDEVAWAAGCSAPSQPQQRVEDAAFVIEPE